MSDIILCSNVTFAKRTKLPLHAADSLLQTISSLCAPRSTTVAAALASLDVAEAPAESVRDAISLGDAALDDLVGGGGVQLGLVTEIAGESATGKTHLCLHLALQVQLPPSYGGVQGGCIMLCSEGAFPSKRMKQIAEDMVDRLDPEADVETAVTGCMDNVHLLRGEDVESLQHALQYAVPAKIESLARSPTSDAPPVGLPVKLLILDSLAAPLRASTASSTTVSMVQRSKDLNLIADALKRLAHRYHLAVVVVNQVTDVIEKPPPGPDVQARWRALLHEDADPLRPPSTVSPGGDPFSDGEPRPAWELLYSTQAEFFSGRSRRLRKEAALGLVWANAVNVRLMLHKTGRWHDRGQVRVARLVFSPFAKASDEVGENRAIEYTIVNGGWQVLDRRRTRGVGEAEHVGRKDGEKLTAEDEEMAMWNDVDGAGALDVDSMAAAERAATQSSGHRSSSPH